MSDLEHELGKSHHELLMIEADGTIHTWCYGYQPTTNDIADRGYSSSYTHCVQKIGGVYEVYDLSTLKRMSPFGDGTWTIGLPVAVHKDLDAALMMAVLSE